MFVSAYMWDYELIWFWLILHKPQFFGLFCDFWAYISLLYHIINLYKPIGVEKSQKFEAYVI